MQSKTMEDAVDKVLCKHKTADKIVKLDELNLENIDSIVDVDGCICLVDLDSSSETLKHIPRLVGKMNRTKVITVGAEGKDWYFGNKRLYYPVVEEMA